MIVYDLVCGREHRFEGWFGSADDFARQLAESLIRCPMCDDASIRRTPSANILVSRTPELPRVEVKETNAASETKTPDAQPQQLPADAASADLEGDVNAKVLSLLRKMVSDTENVGRAFAEEARKIHYEEAPRRGIRGQASSEEADALREEGIDFMSLPSFLTSDLN